MTEGLETLNMADESLAEWQARMRIIVSLESILDWAAIEEAERIVLERVIAKVQQMALKEDAERMKKRLCD